MVFVLRNIVYLLLFDDMFNILKHSNYLYFCDIILDFDVGGAYTSQSDMVSSILRSITVQYHILPYITTNNVNIRPLYVNYYY